MKADGATRWQPRRITYQRDAEMSALSLPAYYKYDQARLMGH